MYRVSFVLAVCLSCLSSTAEANPPGFESPEAAFRSYVTGAVNEDFDLMLSALTRESKAYHIGLAIFSASYLFGEDPAMQKLLRDHGLQPAADADQQEGSDETALVDAMLQIKDPGKLMQKIAARHHLLAEQLSESDDRGADTKPRAKEERLQVIAAVRLRDVKITEDSATAFVELATPAKEALTGLPETIAFRRINGRWYCDIDPR